MEVWNYKVASVRYGGEGKKVDGRCTYLGGGL